LDEAVLSGEPYTTHHAVTTKPDECIGSSDLRLKVEAGPPEHLVEIPARGVDDRSGRRRGPAVASNVASVVADHHQPTDQAWFFANHQPRDTRRGDPRVSAGAVCRWRCPGGRMLRPRFPSSAGAN
jgi:hypothetical protein